MNGVAEVSIKGQKYHLKFGMQAFLIFQQKSGNNTVGNDTIEGGLKAICDLFFAGLTGNSIRNELPIRSYAECCDLFDELTLETDFNAQVSELWRVFNDSIKAITPSEKEPVKKSKSKKSEPIDKEAILALALGKMGLSPSELEQYTYAQFELKCRGFSDLRIDDENRFRKLVYHLYVINTPADTRKDIDIDALWPNAKSIKKAETRSSKAKTKVYSTMLDFWKKRKGLS